MSEDKSGGIRNALEVHSQQINGIVAALDTVAAAKKAAQDFLAWIEQYTVNLAELRTRTEEVAADLVKMRTDCEAMFPAEEPAAAKKA